MDSVITRIQDSELYTIGTNLSELGKRAADVKAAARDEDKEEITAYKMSYRATGANGSEQMKGVCSGLAMSTIEKRAGKWEIQTSAGPNNCDGISAFADVKFIFEKENEKVVVIPHTDALDYARQDPPLEEGGYYDDFAHDHVMRLRDAVLVAVNADDDLHPHAAALKAMFNKIIETHYASPDDARKTAILYEQLGGYTCRQCG